MNDIIDSYQSAFIPGRLISDNILIAFECLHWIRSSKSREGYVAIKLDMSKAYDRVEWPFLIEAMRRIGFSSKWIRLIYECVSSVSYNICINGCLTESFKPSRGLRQGDPLSPYLFVICAQSLSSLFIDAMSQNKFSGIKVARTAPAISHLFFADDSLVMVKATKSQCLALKDCLNTYEATSGQIVNYDKSAITFSPQTSTGNREMVKMILGIRISNGHDIYLGLPPFSIRTKRFQFKYLVDRIRQHINSWSHKKFSEGGKEVLIKSVLQAIPSYAMSCFRIPTSVCLDMEKLIARFWWGTSDEHRRIHWKKWKEMCMPKEEGGMNFRSLVLFNKALLAKQVWRILHRPNSLVGKLFKARYFRQVDIMDADLGSNPSFIWRSMIWSRDILDNGIRWKIGNGKTVHIFKDKWIADFEGGRLFSRIASGSKVDRFITDNYSWDEDLIRSAFLPIEAEAILRVPLMGNAEEDLRYWPWNASGYVVLKEDESIVLAGGRCIHNPGTVMAAELSAAELGLRVCIQKKIQVSGLRMDSYEAVKALQASCEVFGKEDALVQKIKNHMHLLLLWDCEHVPRHENLIAHSLAQVARNFSAPFDWVGKNIPEYVRKMWES